jgi:hypothetical protein
MIVDAEDSGRNAFIDVATGTNAGDMARWRNRYSAETQAALLASAERERREILTARIWLPVAFVILAAAWLPFGLWWQRGQLRHRA